MQNIKTLLPKGKTTKRCRRCQTDAKQFKFLEIFCLLHTRNFRKICPLSHLTKAFRSFNEGSFSLVTAPKIPEPTTLPILLLLTVGKYLAPILLAMATPMSVVTANPRLLSSESSLSMSSASVPSDTIDEEAASAADAATRPTPTPLMADTNEEAVGPSTLLQGGDASTAAVVIELSPVAAEEDNEEDEVFERSRRNRREFAASNEEMSEEKLRLMGGGVGEHSGMVVWADGHGDPGLK